MQFTCCKNKEWADVGSELERECIGDLPRGEHVANILHNITIAHFIHDEHRFLNYKFLFSLQGKNIMSAFRCMLGNTWILLTVFDWRQPYTNNYVDINIKSCELWNFSRPCFVWCRITYAYFLIQYRTNLV